MRALYLLALPALLTGCPAAVPISCTVIDIAHDLCTVIRLPGPDGGTVSVRVPREELEGLAKREQIRQAAQDGGAAP